jgi:hypothetical protein
MYKTDMIIIVSLLFYTCFNMSVSVIDSYICAMILEEDIMLSIVQYDFKSYLCIYLPKNQIIFWDSDIYIYKTIFTVLNKISENTYIVSKAEYSKSSDPARMISIESLISLYSFMTSKYHIPKRLYKKKSKFAKPTYFDVKNSFLVVLE